MKNTSDLLAKEIIDLQNQTDFQQINSEHSINLLEPHYTFLFENTTDSIAYCQIIFENEIPTDFIYLEVNPAFEKLTGFNQLKGKKITELFPDIKSKNPEVVEIGIEVALTGIPQQFDTYIHYLGIWLSAAVISPQKGYFIALMRDITASKESELAVKENEEKYRNLINHSPDIVYKISTKRGGLFWSDRVIDILGYTPEEMKNTSDIWINSVHPDDKKLASNAVSDFEKGEKYDIEYRFKSKSGEWVWLHDCFTSVQEIGDEIIIEGHASDITAQKNAQLALKISEEKYRTLADNTQDIINRFDRNYRHLFASPSATTLTGINHLDYIGKSHREMGFAAEDCDSWEKAIEEVFVTKQNYRQYIEFDGTSGKVYLDWLLSPEFDYENNVVSVLGHVRDITEIKKGEYALKESEEKFRTYFKDDKSVKLLINSKTGAITEINQAAVNFYGYREEELTSMNISQINMLSSVERDSVMDNIIEKEKNYFILNHKLSSGEIRNVEVYSTPLNIKNETLIFSVIHDITERVKMEETLKESEEKYKTLFENSGTGNVVVDINGIYHNINKRAAEVFGGKPEQIIGKSMFDFMPIEMAEKYLLQNRELIEKGSSREYEDTFTFGNKEITFNISDSPLKDKDGNYYALQSISHNITERKRAELALKQSQEELIKFASHLQDIREEERSSLSREIHDEVAQFLVVLKMQTGMLLRKFNAGIHGTEQIYLKEEIENLVNLSDKTLKNTRRIMSGLRAEELELVGFIESAKLYINNFRNQHNIQCNLKTSLDSLHLKPQQTVALYRILQEALMNIAHHSLAKMVFISIDLVDDKLIFKIKDDGVGFDLQSQKKKDSFGLTGVRERAILLEADIKIESEPGKGTTITLEIPYQS